MGKLVSIARGLRAELSDFCAPSPVTHVYRPLEYAWQPAQRYLRRYGQPKKQALLVGMNPGPFGMAQTGVPFGDVAMVRDVLGIDGEVLPLAECHPMRPVQGFSCPRREVSGTRLWGFVHTAFSSVDAFFADYFVYNHCPLVFMEQSGRNFTPDKLPPAAKDRLMAVCDEALGQTAKALGVHTLVGIGAFAFKRCLRVAQTMGEPWRVAQLLHPSPASPLANRGWASQAAATLKALGLPVGTAAPAAAARRAPLARSKNAQRR